jgi:hypothetical protein
MFYVKFLYVFYEISTISLFMFSLGLFFVSKKLHSLSNTDQIPTTVSIIQNQVMNTLRHKRGL